ncbi:MAG: hypothetical protein ACT4O6_17730 [Reyranella sp.]
MNRTLLAIALLGASIAATTAVQAQSWTPSAEESYAKSVIQSAGYSGVSALTRGSDGTWHAHALKNNAKVNVSVDRAGRVTTN